MKAGKELENYVQYVYSKLLEIRSYENTIVSTNVSICGKSGVNHEFDVYYEFEHLNIKCKVAIECKDWSTAISLVQVRDFSSKLDDLNNVLGVIVSRNGYQSGAEKFAKSKGITLLCESELPTLIDIVKGVIKKGFIPDKNVEGRPFWALMEANVGEVTGTYYVIQRNEQIIFPLFFSKIVAKKFLGKLPDSYAYEVIGISQYQLKFMIEMAKLQRTGFGICVLPYWEESSYTIEFVFVSPDKLKEEYLY